MQTVWPFSTATRFAWALTGNSALAIESPHDIGEQHCQVRRENTNQLAFWSRGIQKRTEQIKDGALLSSGQSQPHFRQRSKRRVIGSREYKSATESFDAFTQIIRLEINCDPERFQHVGAAAARSNAAVAVFHDCRPACSQNECYRS